MEGGGKKGSKKGMGGLPPGDPQRFMEAYQGFMTQLSMLRNVPIMPMVSTTAQSTSSTTSTSSSSTAAAAAAASAAMLHPAFPSSSQVTAEDLQRAALMQYYGMLPMAMGVNPFIFNSYWPSASMNLQKLAKEKTTDEKAPKKDKQDKERHRDKKRVSDRGPVANNRTATATKPDKSGASHTGKSQKSQAPSASLLKEVEQTVASSSHSSLSSKFSPTSASSVYPPYEGLLGADLRRSSTGLPIQPMLKSPVDKVMSSTSSASSKTSEPAASDEGILDLSSNKKRPADSTSSPSDEAKHHSDLSSTASKSPALSPTGPLLSPTTMSAKKGGKTKRRGFSLEQAVQKLKEKTGEKVSSTSSAGEPLLSLFSPSSERPDVQEPEEPRSLTGDLDGTQTSVASGSYPGLTCDPDSSTTHGDVCANQDTSSVAEQLKTNPPQIASLLDELRKGKKGSGSKPASRPKSGGLLQNLTQLIETTVERSYEGDVKPQGETSISSSNDRAEAEKQAVHVPQAGDSVKDVKKTVKGTGAKGKKGKQGARGKKVDAIVEKIKESTVKDTESEVNDVTGQNDTTTTNTSDTVDNLGGLALPAPNLCTDQIPDTELTKCNKDTKVKGAGQKSRKQTGKKGAKVKPESETASEDTDAHVNVLDVQSTDISDQASGTTASSSEQTALSEAVSCETQNAPSATLESSDASLNQLDAEAASDETDTSPSKGTKRKRQPVKNPSAKRKQADSQAAATSEEHVIKDTLASQEVEDVKETEGSKETETKEELKEEEQNAEQNDGESEAAKEAKLLEALYQETDERVLRKRPGRPCVFPREFVPKEKTPRQPKKKPKSQDMLERLEPISGQLDDVPVLGAAPANKPGKKRKRGKGSRLTLQKQRTVQPMPESEKIVGTILPLDTTEVKQEIKDEIVKLCEEGGIAAGLDDPLLAPVPPTEDSQPKDKAEDSSLAPSQPDSLSDTPLTGTTPKKKGNKKGSKKATKEILENQSESNAVITDIDAAISGDSKQLQNTNTETVIDIEPLIKSAGKKKPKGKSKAKKKLEVIEAEASVDPPPLVSLQDTSSPISAAPDTFAFLDEVNEQGPKKKKKGKKKAVKEEAPVQVEEPVQIPEFTTGKKGKKGKKGKNKGETEVQLITGSVIDEMSPLQEMPLPQEVPAPQEGSAAPETTPPKTGRKKKVKTVETKQEDDTSSGQNLISGAAADAVDITDILPGAAQTDKPASDQDISSFNGHATKVKGKRKPKSDSAKGKKKSKELFEAKKDSDSDDEPLSVTKAKITSESELMKTENEISTPSSISKTSEMPEPNSSDIAQNSMTDHAILANLQQQTEFLHRALSSSTESQEKKGKFQSKLSPKKAAGKRLSGEELSGGASVYDFNEEEEMESTEEHSSLKSWRTHKMSSPTAKQALHSPFHIASPPKSSVTPSKSNKGDKFDLGSPENRSQETSVTAMMEEIAARITPPKSELTSTAMGYQSPNKLQSPVANAKDAARMQSPAAKAHTYQSPVARLQAGMSPASDRTPMSEAEISDQEETPSDSQTEFEEDDLTEDDLIAKGLMRVPTPEPSLHDDKAISITMKENRNYTQDNSSSVSQPWLVEPPASALQPITSKPPAPFQKPNTPRLVTSACISSPVVADSRKKPTIPTSLPNTPPRSNSSTFSDDFGFSPSKFSALSSDALSTPGKSSAAGSPFTLNFSPEKIMMMTDSGSVSLDSSPMKNAIDSVKNESDLVHRLKANLKEEVPHCACLGDTPYDERLEGPYYTHLGAAPDVPGVRKLMEQRTGLTGSAIRIEKVFYTGKEGKSPQGCPVAKWVIRRAGPEEKVLVVVRPRLNHHCETAVMIIGIVVWEGVSQAKADHLYNYLIRTLPTGGFETERRCGTNEQKTCACQGWQGEQSGASFSFGCSWSMYYNGCKFARSAAPRKFKLKPEPEEPVLEDKLQDLATELAPVYKQMAPDSYVNMTHYEEQAQACRLGRRQGRPWSGVTACMDFCAHAHKDLQNMNNGCTMVVTLTKHRGFGKPEDEQLHVLPLCVMDMTDEQGSMEGQRQKVLAGALECLTRYPMRMRIRPSPLLSKRKRMLAKKYGIDAIPKKRGRPCAVQGVVPLGPQQRCGLGRGRQRTLPGIKKMYRTPEGQVVAYRFTPDGKCVRVKAGGKRALLPANQEKIESLPELPPTLPNGTLHPNMYPPGLKQEIAQLAQTVQVQNEQQQQQLHQMEQLQQMQAQPKQEVTPQSQMPAGQMISSQSASSLSSAASASSSSSPCQQPTQPSPQSSQPAAAQHPSSSSQALPSKQPDTQSQQPTQLAVQNTVPADRPVNQPQITSPTDRQVKQAQNTGLTDQQQQGNQVTQNTSPTSQITGSQGTSSQQQHMQQVQQQQMQQQLAQQQHTLQQQQQMQQQVKQQQQPIQQQTHPTQPHHQQHQAQQQQHPAQQQHPTQQHPTQQHQHPSQQQHQQQQQQQQQQQHQLYQPYNQQQNMYNQQQHSREQQEEQRQMHGQFQDRMIHGGQMNQQQQRFWPGQQAGNEMQAQHHHMQQPNMPPHAQMPPHGPGPQNRSGPPSGGPPGGPPFGGPGMPPFPPGHPALQEKSGHTSNVTMELNGWFAKWSAKMDPSQMEQMEGKEIGMDGLPKPLPPGKSILEELVDDLLPPPYPAGEKMPGMPGNMDRWQQQQQPGHWRPDQAMEQVQRTEFGRQPNEQMQGPPQAFGMPPQASTSGSMPFPQQQQQGVPHHAQQGPDAGPHPGGRAFPPYGQQQPAPQGQYPGQNMPGAGNQWPGQNQPWPQQSQRDERWSGQQQQQWQQQQQQIPYQPWQAWNQQHKWSGQGEKREEMMNQHQWQGSGYGYQQQQQPQQPQQHHPGPQHQMPHPHMQQAGHMQGTQQRPYPQQQYPGQQRWNQNQQQWPGKEFEDQQQWSMQQQQMQQRQFHQQQQQQHAQGQWPMQQQQQQQKGMNDWNQPPSVDVRPASVSSQHWQHGMLSPGGQSSQSAPSPFPGPPTGSRPGSRCSSIGPSSTPQPLDRQSPFVNPGRQFPQQQQISKPQMHNQGQMPPGHGQMHANQGQLQHGQMVSGQGQMHQGQMQQGHVPPNQMQHQIQQQAAGPNQQQMYNRSPHGPMGEQSAVAQNQMAHPGTEFMSQSSRDPLNLLGDKNQVAAMDDRANHRPQAPVSYDRGQHLSNNWQSQPQPQNAMTQNSPSNNQIDRAPTSQTNAQDQFQNNTVHKQVNETSDTQRDKTQNEPVRPANAAAQVSGNCGDRSVDDGNKSQPGDAASVPTNNIQKSGETSQMNEQSERRVLPAAGSQSDPVESQPAVQHLPHQAISHVQNPSPAQPAGNTVQTQLMHSIPVAAADMGKLLPGQTVTAADMDKLMSGQNVTAADMGKLMPGTGMQNVSHGFKAEVEPEPQEVVTDCAELFSDPDIGGVAIALSHGAVLFEVAKRELHATTAMKKPDRFAPTRISLVFYQHKNLNLANHGAEEYEKRAEVWRQRRQEKLGLVNPPSESEEPLSKRRWPWDPEEYPEIRAKYAQVPEVRQEWPAPLNMPTSSTTSTVSTKWTLPRPAIVGPYQRWT